MVNGLISVITEEKKLSLYQPAKTYPVLVGLIRDKLDDSNEIFEKLKGEFNPPLSS
jgi:hypothetical protein